MLCNNNCEHQLNWDYFITSLSLGVHIHLVCQLIVSDLMEWVIHVLRHFNSPKNVTSWKRLWRWNNIFLANNYQIKLRYSIFYGPYLQRSHFGPFGLRKMVCFSITICGMRENHLEKSCGRGWLNMGCWNDNIFWSKSKIT